MDKLPLLEDFLDNNNIDYNGDHDQLHNKYIIVYALHIIRSICSAHRTADPHGNCNNCPLLTSITAREGKDRICGITNQCHDGYGHKLYEGPLTWDIKTPTPWTAFKK